MDLPKRFIQKETRYCRKHDLIIYPFFSEKQNKTYWFHKDGDKTCWVQSEEEIDGFRERQVDYGRDNLL